MSWTAAALWLASLELAGAAVFAVAALLDLGLRRRAAATRRDLWALAIVVALALPLTRLALPAPRLALAPGLAAAFLALWTAGTLLLLLRLARAHAHARRLVAGSVPLVDPAWHACLAALRAPGERPRVALRVSTAVDAPQIAGVLRPTLLVPPHLLAVPPDERRALLAHELAHVARADCLLLLAGAVARAIYWVTPAPWHALRRLRLHAEDAADDAALRTGIPSSSYAAQLVALARDRLGPAPRDPAGAKVVAADGLRERVRAILDVRRIRSLAPAGARELPRMVAAALLLATMVTACEARADDPAVVVTAAP